MHVNPDIHPHTIPVYIKSLDDLKSLGEEMRREAMYDPVEEKPDYSDLDTPEKLREHKEENFDHLMRTTRFIVLFDGQGHRRLCSVVVTMDKYDGKSKFHMSIVEQRQDDSSPIGISHFRIPDGPAQLIAENILGGPCEEMPHEGRVFVQVRDFTREAA